MATPKNTVQPLISSKMEGFFKWIDPDPFTDDYYLVWFTRDDKVIRIANVYTFGDYWAVSTPKEYGDILGGFDTKRQAQAYIEKYFGIKRRTPPRTKTTKKTK